LGSKKPQSGYALCGVFLRHILARRNASHCFMGGPKRHIQPERYVQLRLKFVEKYTENSIDKIMENSIIKQWEQTWKRS
jgi:hypothetical protein